MPPFSYSYLNQSFILFAFFYKGTASRELLVSTQSLPVPQGESFQQGDCNSNSQFKEVGSTNHSGGSSNLVGQLQKPGKRYTQSQKSGRSVKSAVPQSKQCAEVFPEWYCLGTRKIITSVSNKPMVVTLSNIWMKVSSKVHCFRLMTAERVSIRQPEESPQTVPQRESGIPRNGNIGNAQQNAR